MQTKTDKKVTWKNYKTRGGSYKMLEPKHTGGSIYEALYTAKYPKRVEKFSSKGGFKQDPHAVETINKWKSKMGGKVFHIPMPNGTNPIAVDTLKDTKTSGGGKGHHSTKAPHPHPHYKPLLTPEEHFTLEKNLRMNINVLGGKGFKPIKGGNAPNRTNITIGLDFKPSKPVNGIKSGGNGVAQESVWIGFYENNTLIIDVNQTKKMIKIDKVNNDDILMVFNYLTNMLTIEVRQEGGRRRSSSNRNNKRGGSGSNTNNSTQDEYNSSFQSISNGNLDKINGLDGLNMLAEVAEQIYIEEVEQNQDIKQLTSGSIALLKNQSNSEQNQSNSEQNPSNQQKSTFNVKYFILLIATVVVFVFTAMKSTDPELYYYGIATTSLSVVYSKTVNGQLCLPPAAISKRENTEAAKNCKTPNQQALAPEPENNVLAITAAEAPAAPEAPDYLKQMQTHQQNILEQIESLQASLEQSKTQMLNQITFSEPLYELYTSTRTKLPSIEEIIKAKAEETQEIKLTKKEVIQKAVIEKLPGFSALPKNIQTNLIMASETILASQSKAGEVATSLSFTITQWSFVVQLMLSVIKGLNLLSMMRTTMSLFRNRGSREEVVPYNAEQVNNYNSLRSYITNCIVYLVYLGANQGVALAKQHVLVVLEATKDVMTALNQVDESSVSILTSIFNTGSVTDTFTQYSVGKMSNIGASMVLDAYIKALNDGNTYPNTLNFDNILALVK